MEAELEKIQTPPLSREDLMSGKQKTRSLFLKKNIRRKPEIRR